MDNVISIIIPTYNRAHSLLGTIESVLDQSVGNWELIIVDDGSTDSTADKVNSFLKDERIKYYYQKNLGVSSARNKGVEKSNGDFLIFLDSDDCFKPGLLERLIKVSYWRYDIICWPVQKKVNGQIFLWKPKRLEKVYQNITATFLAGSICYKREIFEKVGGFDPRINFGENYELGMRVSQLHDLRVKLLSQAYLLYNFKPTPDKIFLIENKLVTIHYLLEKHKKIYVSDPVSHSRLLHQKGWLLQKIGDNKKAIEYYLKALKVRPTYIKPFLRILYLKMKFLISIKIF